MKLLSDSAGNNKSSATFHLPIFVLRNKMVVDVHVRSLFPRPLPYPFFSSLNEEDNAKATTAKTE